MGQVGTGKTHSLFGSSNAPAADQDLCTQILATLFSRIRQADIPQDLSVFLSMWDVVTDAVSGVVDVRDLLLTDPSDSGKLFRLMLSTSFTNNSVPNLPHNTGTSRSRASDSQLSCVAIDSLSDALQALNLFALRVQKYKY
jgi:hypothetical protein